MMTDWLLIATLFLHPLQPNNWQRALLLLPLCLSIAIVYKATRCDNVRQIPLASLVLWGTIVVALYLVGGGLLVLHTLVLRFA